MIKWKKLKIFKQFFKKKNTIEYLSQEFYFLNSHDSISGSKLFELIMSCDFCENSFKHKFWIDNISYFNPKQKQQIIGTLNVKISPTDFFYHKLVSDFNLKSQIPFLETHITDNLFIKIKRGIESHKISKWNIFQLKNFATLINLGYDKYDEDLYIKEINNLYAYAKEKKELNIFYLDVLYNSIALLNSKKSIIKTLYMIDESEKSPVELYNDVAEMGYPFKYVLSCILPKINNSEMEIMVWTHLNANKEKIKQLILHDNSIWKDNIRK